MKKKLEAAVPQVTTYVYKINIFRNGHAFWSSSFVRLCLYTLGAMITAFLTATDKIIDGDELTTFQWVRIGCGVVTAGIITIRAFLDQTVARNSETAKANNSESPVKSA